MKRATAFIFFCLVFIACNASEDTTREDTTRVDTTRVDTTRKDTTREDTTREAKVTQRSSIHFIRYQSLVVLSSFYTCIYHLLFYTNFRLAIACTEYSSMRTRIYLRHGQDQP